MQRFPYGIHIPVDDLREWVISGTAHPVPTWSDETTRQFTLARQSAVDIARRYHTSGFAVALDDIIYPLEAETVYLRPLSGLIVHKVLLLPSVDAVLQRNAARLGKNFDPQILADPIRSIHTGLSNSDALARGWLVLDTTSHTIAESVDLLLRRISS